MKLPAKILANKFIYGLSILWLFLLTTDHSNRAQTFIDRKADTSPQSGDMVNRNFEIGKPILEGGRRVWIYELRVSETSHTLQNGQAYKVWAYNDQVPGPTIVAREGDWVRITLINETSVNHTIHSHGLHVPQRMDGVPHDHGAEISTANSHDAHPTSGREARPMPVAPGGTFTYEYIARPAGTHWYHCHIGVNEHLNRGMAGSLIVLPKAAEPRFDVDVILMLQEWDSRFAKLGQPGNPRDLFESDFFTINGLSYPKTRPIVARLGDVVRIRMINAGSISHSMHLHGMSFIVTHKDGFPLAEPVEMDTVSVSPGERIDIIVVGNNPGEWPFHCHTASHQTNAGVYPGGMMTHLRIGPIRSPRDGDGPVGNGLTDIRNAWRQYARIQLGLRP